MINLKSFLLFVVISMFSISLSAQNKTVHGNVLDANGEPLIGAAVKVKDDTSGTITDFNGYFTLSVPNSAKMLEISYMGYVTQEVNITDRKINVVMNEDAKMLDDVVVVGYSSQKRSSLTGSVVTLTADKIQDVTSANVASSLQGKVAGVQVNSASGAPGSTPEILIRGAGSITAQANPLYVVDGISGGTYNPNDVETITVLKDAAATSLYGSAAAGGVIIVTTKKAQMDQPVSISFKGTLGSKTINNGNFQMMNGEQLYEYHKSAMLPEVFEITRPVSLKRQNYDWLNSAFSSGLIQNYNLSIAGGTNKVSYRVSADYFDEAGTLINTDYKRWNIRGNFNFQLHKDVRLSTNVSFTNSNDRSYAWYTLQDAYSNMPWDNPYDASGNLVFINSGRRPDDGKVWYGNRKMNFLHNEEYNFDKSYGHDLVADATLIWNIGAGFSFETRNRGSVSASKYTSYRDSRTFDPSWSSRGMVSEANNDGVSLATTNLLRYSAEVSNHTFDAFVGAEFSYWRTSANGATGVDLPNAGLSSLSIASTYQDVYSSIIESAGISYLGQFQYGYKNKYLATISCRTDASSAFGPANRWGVFPAGSLAWVISNEEFLKNNIAVSFLKLRGSYGLTGNSNIGQFRYLSNYSMSAKYNGETGAVPTQLGNLALGWETAYMANVGVDISFIKRINLSVDLYNTDNKDLLLNVPLPVSGGFEFQLRNAGAVRNQGVEIQLSTINFNGKFKWTTDFNISANKNKVLYLPDSEAFSTSVAGSTTLAQRIEEGTDIFTWYLPKWMGVDPATGSPTWSRTKDAEGNEIPEEVVTDYALANPQKVGSANPKFTGGINNTFSYWGFSLGINCSFVYGNLIYNQGRETFDNDGASMDMNQMLHPSSWSRWEKPGDIATHPKVISGGNNNSGKTSSRYLEDGSYFKIRNITLGYDFSTSLLSKFKCKKLRLFVSVDNPFTFTNYSGMDPEVSFQRGEYILPGLQSFKYPNSIQFLGGLEFTF